MDEFDMSFTYDGNLTEVPADRDSFYKGILEFEKQATFEKDRVKKAKLLSKIGELYRIYGDYYKSEKYLSDALNLLNESENLNEYFVTKFRLAHTNQKLKKFDEAIRYFEELEEKSVNMRELNSYEDFVYQHMGKLYFDMEKCKEALRYFEKAKAIRLKKNDYDLINSTELAIRITLDKLL